MEKSIVSILTEQMASLFQEMSKKLKHDKTYLSCKIVGVDGEKYIVEIDGTTKAVSALSGDYSVGQLATITVPQNDWSKAFIAPSGGGGSGTTNHNVLTNRSMPNQHPISAITGLQEALDNAGGGGGSSMTYNVTVPTIGWVSNQITIAVPGLLGTKSGVIGLQAGASQAVINEIGISGISVHEINIGSVTFKCLVPPTISLPITIIEQGGAGGGSGESPGLVANIREVELLASGWVQVGATYEYTYSDPWFTTGGFRYLVGASDEEVIKARDFGILMLDDLSSGVCKFTAEILPTINIILRIEKVIQATDSGSLIDTMETMIAQAIAASKLAENPIGTIRISTDDINPATYIGGTWAAWGAGRVPVGVDANDADFNAPNKTGGTKTCALTVAEMPSHTHPYTSPPFYFSELETDNAILGSTTAVSPFFSRQTGAAGAGNAHNNLQPYITCYMWKRTA